MKRSILFLVVLIMSWSFTHLAVAQLPSPSVPLNLDLGLFGGGTVPLRTLSDITNAGWNAGAKVRLSGFMPLNVLISGQYNRIPFKTVVLPPVPLTQVALNGESMTAITAGAGLEYPLMAAIVKPYLGVDGFVSIISSTASGATSTTREGLGVGAGVLFGVPAFGSFDLSAKYQMLNLMGKESGEDTQAQVSVSLAIMFGVL